MLKSNLNINNRLSLIGQVADFPKRYTSPSGIGHCRFSLEHRSEQMEAGLPRQAWCKMAIQVSGELIAITQSITVGRQLLVVGFITSHKTANGLSQLVLHAEQIEFID
ncbi:primosomal replication protein N [Caviibacterium pharyngocola]|uniref:Replication restart protein PriB n=1 Tax=Caviibacterium pharyngocola TaxID=28159 RepID=A0A2M8RVE1_9PAST|nr:primosomal replication protein N [Caviibacterium pharyngocola]PJG82843.1 primosomal replication protein N [Caviibacterium pharyngocola]